MSPSRNAVTEYLLQFFHGVLLTASPQELLGLQQEREGKANEDDHDVYAEKWDNDISHWRGRIKGPVSMHIFPHRLTSPALLSLSVTILFVP